MQKMRDFQFFMTVEDEKLFCQKLREFNRNIVFLDTKPLTQSNLRIFDCVSNSLSSSFSIVNLDLISKEKLAKSYVKYGDYYHFPQIDKAQMQFLRSHPDIHSTKDLQHGRIADSYDPEDEEEKKWKNKVYSILKKLGYKVHWFYTNLEGNLEIKEKPENRLIALQDALKKYNGTKGQFMIHTRAKFVGEDFKIEEL
jgi:hypothetical protein